ncbi:probable spherulin 1A precursor [Fusarium torulosum]|uniref:Probable spherulin 1A n=1 Tax=Fusarium torulosum TaxID=33205 RepID=A0AAE8MP55_9HYPO|nr:probable spherulin 1A precursor [Fusarium torulosum]
MKFLSILLLTSSALTALQAAQSSSHLPRGDSINYILPPIVPINTRSGDRDLISRIITAPTQAERVKLLNQPGDYVFDFKASTGAGEAHDKGGRSVSATALTMPALIGNGASMIVAFLGPYGRNTAHIHNRATELNIVVKGRLVIKFVIENGAKPIANTMDTFRMTIAQDLFALNGDVVQATLDGVQTINGKDIKSFRSYIPADIALGIDACSNIKC